VDRNRNNVVLSRKAIIEDERKEQRKTALDNIEIGQIKKGMITSIADFGAFVDVDGIDGLIHISELSWNHVKHPSEVVKVNDEVSVEVLDIDRDKQRLSLGLKQTQKDPWLEKIKNYKNRDVVTGKVTRIVKFGLFVQIEPGMEGLVHITELSIDPVKRPSEIAKIGDELNIRIIDIDFDKRRMAFSVRLVEHPELAEEKKSKEYYGERDRVKDKDRTVSETAKKEVKVEAKAEKEGVKSGDAETSGRNSKKETELSAAAEEKTAGMEMKAESEEVKEDLGGIDPEEKKKTIRKLLEEMKHEANLD